MKKDIEIGLRLKKLRRGLHQEVYAKRIGVSYRAYQNYESGKRIPTAAVLKKIAEKASVTVDWILKGDLQLSEKKAIAERIEASFLKENRDLLKLTLVNRLNEMGIPAPHDIDGFIDTAVYLIGRGKFQDFLLFLTIDETSLLYGMKKQVEKIYLEGNDKKIEAVRSLLEALDTGEGKKQN